MTIEVEGPDGSVIEFPDGTAPDKIKQVMSRSAKRDYTRLESAGRGALQGASFGLSDEIGAGIEAGVHAAPEIADLGSKIFSAPMRAISSFMGYEPEGDISTSAGNVLNKAAPKYDKSLGEIRQANDDAYQQNPLSYTGGAVVGGVATTALPVVGQMGRVAQGASLGTKAYQGAKAGAALGGLAGFGHSQGGPSERAAGAASGAAVGLGVGGTLPYVLHGGGAAWNALSNRYQAAVNPKGRAEAMVAQALADDLAPKASSPQAAAARMAAKTNQSPVKFDPRRASSEPATGDATLRLMDMGGENTKNLLRSAANQKSPAAETLRKHLDARQGTQWSRLERGTIDMVSPPKPPSIWATRLSDIARYEPEEIAKDLTERARRWSEPLFKKAFSEKIPVTEKLVEVLNRPAIKRMAELAQDAAANEGKEPANAVELLHRIKMQIDRQIGQAKRGVQDQKAGASWDVRTLTTLKKDLVDAIDVPSYKDALKIYSGPAAIRNAMEDGFDDALSQTPKAIELRMAEMSGDVLEAYRVGLANKVVQKIRAGNVNRDRVSGVFGSPDVQKLIRVMAPNKKSANQFRKMLVEEAKMNKTRAAVQGNSTTAKQLTQMDESAQALGGVRAAAGAAMGRIAPIMDDLSRRMARLGGMTPEVANEVIKAGMATTSTASQTELLKQIAKARRSGEGLDELAKYLLRAGIAAGNTGTEGP